MIGEKAADLIKAAHSLPIAHQFLQRFVSARGRHHKGQYAKENIQNV
jgi:hypothetical protein